MTDAEGDSTGGSRGTLPRTDLGIAAFVCVALALAWTLPLSDAQAWGWDESMHAELPAARMVVALRLGELGQAFEALHSCSQYPFVWPVVLAAVQLVTGISEHAGRVAGTLAWCATLFGLVCVAREVVHSLRRRQGASRGDRIVPFAALLLGALCPLALAFAGTYFLEVPATCAIVWALYAWLVRARATGTGHERRAELIAGAAIACAFFTKFNYALLLVLALGLDWTFELVAESRAGRRAAYLRRTLWLAAVPALLLVWWFVLPLPMGLAVAAEHRMAFSAFLGGNQGFGRTSDAARILYVGDWFAYTPRLLALEIVLALVALRWVRVAGVRVLLLVLLATTVPIALHPFHDPRFQVVCGPALWLLAPMGWRLVSAGPWPVRNLSGFLLVACLLGPDWDRQALARATGHLPADGPTRAYVLAQLDAWKRLGGSRPLPTAGLARVEHAKLSTTIAGEVGHEERVAWIGMSSQYSPAVLHLALLQHGGSPRRFLAESTRTLDVDYFGDAAGVTDEVLVQFLGGFDVVLLTEPPDLKSRSARVAAFAGYRERLAKLGWTPRPIGHLSIERPLGPPLPVSLYACRPNR